MIGFTDLTIYSTAILRSLDHDNPPPRAVRRLLFKLYLWKPIRQRTIEAFDRTVWRSAHTDYDGHPGPSTQTSTLTDTSDMNSKQSAQRSHDRSVPVFPSLSIGWLNAQSLSNKTTAVHELIEDRNYDVFTITETWHVSYDDICLRQACPSAFSVAEAARKTGRGGGIAVLYRSHFKSTPITLPDISSFELLCHRFKTTAGAFIILAVYRPGSAAVNQIFFNELSSVLEILVSQHCPIIIGGDFNIHVDMEADPSARQLLELFHSFNLRQHVNQPTHRAMRTLDLVLTYDDAMPVEITVDPPDVVSDHAIITSVLSIQHKAPREKRRLVRSWRTVDRAAFAAAVKASPIGRIPENLTAEEMFDLYQSTLTNLADAFAPLHYVLSQIRPLSPWFDSDCRKRRRQCRRLERRYRRSHAVADRQAWIDDTKNKFDLFRQKKEQYWRKRLDTDGQSSLALWRSLSNLFARQNQPSVSNLSHSADGFADFFDTKIADIRAKFEQDVPPDFPPFVDGSPFSLFHPVSELEVRAVIQSSSTKSSSLDPIPTFLLKEIVDTLLPFITAMVNTSLESAVVPASQKVAIVTPILKKSNLDPEVMSNYRPIANLSFISKTIERVVVKQLNAHLTKWQLLPENQSAYRPHHSTETALLSVLSDILDAADNRQVTLLALLDLSAAFDCVDHEILLQRLEEQFGLSGNVLRWFSSYLTDRTIRVCYNGSLSSSRLVIYGVPQGSILGSVLFIMFTAGIVSVLLQHSIKGHLYADDSQLYSSCDVKDATTTTDRLIACIEDVQTWLRRNRLLLNPSKTDLIWVGSSHMTKLVNTEMFQIGSTTVERSKSVRTLGWTLDADLTMSAHISNVLRSGFFQLRQLRAVLASLSENAVITIVHAVIHGRLDYCNSLYTGITKHQLARLQRLQNAAARLVSGTRRREHIQPVLRRLHWLPVRQRIKYKLLMLVRRCLDSCAPEYLSAKCRQLSLAHRRALRSNLTRSLEEPRTRSSFGDRSFTAAGPSAWNRLPANIRDEDSTIDVFAKHLKTYLFSATEALL